LKQANGRRFNPADFNYTENKKPRKNRGLADWLWEKLERAKGFEPSTPTLASLKLRCARTAIWYHRVPESARDFILDTRHKSQFVELERLLCTTPQHMDVTLM
jgi:hypothetical protein